MATTSPQKRCHDDKTPEVTGQPLRKSPRLWPSSELKTGAELSKEKQRNLRRRARVHFVPPLKFCCNQQGGLLERSPQSSARLPSKLQHGRSPPLSSKEQARHRRTKVVATRKNEDVRHKASKTVSHKVPAAKCQSGEKSRQENGPDSSSCLEDHPENCQQGIDMAAELQTNPGVLVDCDSQVHPVPALKRWVMGPLFQSLKSKVASFTEIVMSPVRLFKPNDVLAEDTSRSPHATEELLGGLAADFRIPEKPLSQESIASKSPVWLEETCELGTGLLLDSPDLSGLSESCDECHEFLSRSSDKGEDLRLSLRPSRKLRETNALLSKISVFEEGFELQSTAMASLKSQEEKERFCTSGCSEAFIEAISQSPTTQGKSGICQTPPLTPRKNRTSNLPSTTPSKSSSSPTPSETPRKWRNSQSSPETLSKRTSSEPSETLGKTRGSQSLSDHLISAIGSEPPAKQCHDKRSRMQAELSVSRRSFQLVTDIKGSETTKTRGGDNCSSLQDKESDLPITMKPDYVKMVCRTPLRSAMDHQEPRSCEDFADMPVVSGTHKKSPLITRSSTISKETISPHSSGRKNALSPAKLHSEDGSPGQKTLLDSKQRLSGTIGKLSKRNQSCTLSGVSLSSVKASRSPLRRLKTRKSVCRCCEGSPRNKTPGSLLALKYHRSVQNSQKLGQLHKSVRRSPRKVDILSDFKSLRSGTRIRASPEQKILKPPKPPVVRNLSSTDFSTQTDTEGESSHHVEVTIHIAEEGGVQKPAQIEPSSREACEENILGTPKTSRSCTDLPPPVRSTRRTSLRLRSPHNVTNWRVSSVTFPGSPSRVVGAACLHGVRQLHNRARASYEFCRSPRKMEHFLDFKSLRSGALIKTSSEKKRLKPSAALHLSPVAISNEPTKAGDSPSKVENVFHHLDTTTTTPQIIGEQSIQSWAEADLASAQSGEQTNLGELGLPGSLAVQSPSARSAQRFIPPGGEDKGELRKSCLGHCSSPQDVPEWSASPERPSVIFPGNIESVTGSVCPQRKAKSHGADGRSSELRRSPRKAGILDFKLLRSGALIKVTSEEKALKPQVVRHISPTACSMQSDRSGVSSPSKEDSLDQIVKGKDFLKPAEIDSSSRETGGEGSSGTPAPSVSPPRVTRRSLTLLRQNNMDPENRTSLYFRSPNVRSSLTSPRGTQCASETLCHHRDIDLHSEARLSSELPGSPRKEGSLLEFKLLRSGALVNAFSEHKTVSKPPVIKHLSSVDTFDLSSKADYSSPRVEVMLHRLKVTTPTVDAESFQNLAKVDVCLKDASVGTSGSPPARSTRRSLTLGEQSGKELQKSRFLHFRSQCDEMKWRPSCHSGTPLSSLHVYCPKEDESQSGAGLFSELLRSPIRLARSREALSPQGELTSLAVTALSEAEKPSLQHRLRRATPSPKQEWGKGSGLMQRSGISKSAQRVQNTPDDEDVEGTVFHSVPSPRMQLRSRVSPGGEQRHLFLQQAGTSSSSKEDAIGTSSRKAPTLIRSYSCPDFPSCRPESPLAVLAGPPLVKVVPQLLQDASKCPRLRRHTVCSLEVEREVAPLCLRKEVFPGCNQGPATRHSTSPLSTLASCFLSSPLAFLSRRHSPDGEEDDISLPPCAPPTSSTSPNFLCSSSSPCPPGGHQSPVTHCSPQTQLAELSSSRDNVGFCQSRKEVTTTPVEEEDEGEKGEFPLLDSDIKVDCTSEGTRGRVSRFRIRKTPPKTPTNLTPMGLPKTVRLNKKKFSLEEIYTNKNFRMPPEGRLETIFEEPVNSRNGSVCLVGQRRMKRILEFPDLGAPRKQKRTLNVTTNSKKGGGARTRRSNAVQQTTRTLTSEELDTLLCSKLSELESWLERDGL
ncbi:uncharacterized protein prr14 isoform X1 [Polypterus senegalus]|uniref:uncharacterized protein prr14 isoform X1 n=1 Tax=Polypterus senegalus TaxID=55291 RepID=UPI0019651F15|nr:uncharacterized protein prr14 isoform X1 [Polypterus senegalus]